MRARNYGHVRTLGPVAYACVCSRGLYLISISFETVRDGCTVITRSVSELLNRGSSLIIGRYVRLLRLFTSPIAGSREVHR